MLLRPLNKLHTNFTPESITCPPEFIWLATTFCWTMQTCEGSQQASHQLYTRFHRVSNRVYLACDHLLLAYAQL